MTNQDPTPRRDDEAADTDVNITPAPPQVPEPDDADESTDGNDGDK